MSCINNTVPDQIIICIPNRNDQIFGITDIGWIIGQDILKFGKNDSRHFFFQQLISIFLQILINRQINIISCLRFFSAHSIRHTSEIINIDGRFSFCTLQHTVKCLLQSCLSYSIRKRISLFIILWKSIILLLGNLPCITDDWCKILCIRIFSDWIFRNIDSGQDILVLHDCSRSFVTDIRCQRCINVLLKTVQVHCIPHIDHL